MRLSWAKIAETTWWRWQVHNPHGDACSGDGDDNDDDDDDDGGVDVNDDDDSARADDDDDDKYDGWRVVDFSLLVLSFRKDADA